MTCVKCGFQNPENARFCSACGIALVQKQESPIVSSVTYEGERRYVTVLFSDMSGYTAMSEKIDPEEVREITTQVFGGIAEIISKYQGFVEKYIGDAVVAIFGAKKSFEDDPVRAVRAAMDIHEFVNDISPEIEQAVHIPIYMHTAVNTGLVVTGKINLEKGTHGVVGDTINVAARLSSHAQRDTILVSRSTYQRIYSQFACQRLEDIRVKGKSKPIAAYRVTAEISARARFFHYPQLHELYLGRDNEITSMKGLAEKITATCKGQIVTITGEAGIGKSRLLAEFTKIQRNRTSAPCDLIECHPAAISEISPFYPFVHFLKKVFAIQESDDDQHAFGKIQEKLATFTDDRALKSLPYLAKLLNLMIPEELEKKIQLLDGMAVRQQLYYIFRKLITQLVQDSPLIIIFEDLQWIDDASAALIEHILPLTMEMPLMIILVCRTMDTGHPDHLGKVIQNKYKAIYTHIALKPLSAEDSIKLVAGLLDMEEITEQIKGLILKKGEGNPFFIVELLQVLIAQQVLERKESTGKWQVKKFEGEINVPDTIRGLIFALIDRLDDEKKQVIKIASVIGRTFLYKILAAIIDTNDYIEDQLSQLQLVKLIRLHAKVPELEYIFYHTLTREAAYESILIRHRRQLHRQAGMAIEELFKDQKEKFYTHLAYHYAQAKDWEQAQDYLFKAGDQAESIAADTEAFGYYKKAIAAYKAAFGKNMDPGQTAVFNRKIGEGFFRRGDHQQALKYLNQAMSYYEKKFPETKWGIRASLFFAATRQLLHRQLPGFFLSKDRKYSNEVIEERAKICEIMGWIDFSLNQERLLLNIIRSMNFFEYHGYVQGIAMSSTGLGLVCDMIKLPKIANIYHRKSLALMDDLKEFPIAKGHCYLGLGWHEDFLGNAEKAVHYYSESVREFGETGDLRRWGNSMLFIALLYARTGDFAKSLDLSKKSHHVGENSGDKQLTGWGLQVQGMVYIHLGRAKKARETIQKAILYLKAVPDFLNMNLANGDLGMCYLHEGDFNKAFDLLMEALQNLHRMKFRGYDICFLKNNIAEYYVKKMKLMGHKKDSQLIKAAARACAGAVKESTYYIWAVPQAYKWQGCFFQLTGKSEKAQKSWRKGLAFAEKLGMEYEVALIRKDMDQTMRTTRH